MTEQQEERDSVERFAADLRRLRLRANEPTLAAIGSQTGISRSVLSEAFAGRTLPSARTVDGIVRACEGDVDEWIDRREALVRLTRPEAPAGEAGESPAAAPSEEYSVPRTSSRGAMILTVAAALIVGVLVSGASAWYIADRVAGARIDSAMADLQVRAQAAVEAEAKAEQAQASGGAGITVETGEDPAQTVCVDDAEVASGDTRADNSLLEIVWSDKCQAGWGRITRYDGKADGNTVTIAIYPETSPNGPDRQEATEHNVQGAYTTLVVRPTGDTLLCAEGSYTVDGKRIDLGDPICI